MQNDLLWRTEAACWTAWPSAEDKLIDGWLCRASGGETRRTNSANATEAAGPVLDMIGPAADFYKDKGQPLLVRTLSFMPEAPEIAEVLAGQGFAPEGETCTLKASLPQRALDDFEEVESHSNPSSDWVADKLRLSPMAPAQQQAYRAMLERLSVPARFARVPEKEPEKGRGVSLAYGAIVDGILVIESVVTDPDHRGKGLAGRVVGSLMAWGAHEGAKLSCLQVEAANIPALHLYKKLGYETELYRYLYWRRF